MTAEDRIIDLELRLDRYHEWLTESIAERDRLALDAAWGVHYALYQSLAVICILAGAYWIFGKLDFFTSLVACLALWASQFVIFSWSNGARMKEVDRLSKLPEWEFKG